MRVSRLALALTLAFGLSTLAEARPKIVHRKSKASMVKPRKAKRIKAHHKRGR